MRTEIEKLLILQDCDQRISSVKIELSEIGPEREVLRAKAAEARQRCADLKRRIQQMEARRKELEIEEEKQRELVQKYSFQQFQTKKNEEYQALGREIERCKQRIDQLQEDQILLLEEIDQRQAELAQLTQEADRVEQEVRAQIQDLEQREQVLLRELEELGKRREELAVQVPASLLARYERIRKARGDRVVVGVEHRVCGGCHMSLPPQVIIAVKADKELVACPNCGRILYYHPGMVLEPREEI